MCGEEDDTHIECPICDIDVDLNTFKCPKCNKTVDEILEELNEAEKVFYDVNSEKIRINTESMAQEMRKEDFSGEKERTTFL